MTSHTVNRGVQSKRARVRAVFKPEANARGAREPIQRAKNKEQNQNQNQNVQRKSELRNTARARDLHHASLINTSNNVFHHGFLRPFMNGSDVVYQLTRSVRLKESSGTMTE